jgi:uncharacterized protein (UPF0147 family)
MLLVNLLNFGKLTVNFISKTHNVLNRLVRDKIQSFITPFKKPTPTPLISEDVKTALKKALYEKNMGRYTKALHIVDDVIKDDPNIPLAAFIKATILWEGFKDPYTAGLGLQRVKQLVPDKNDRLNLMASELIEKIERSSNAK